MTAEQIANRQRWITALRSTPSLHRYTALLLPSVRPDGSFVMCEHADEPCSLRSPDGFTFDQMADLIAYGIHHESIL